MAIRTAIDILAIEICRTIREACQGRPDWISLDWVQERLAFVRLSAINAAVAFAAAKGWLAINGGASPRVLLSQTAP